MFGKIIEIENNEVIIENVSHKALSGLINCHLVFEEPTRKIVGEVIFIDESIAKVLLIGEIANDKFNPGTIKKPAGVSPARIITVPELELIIGKSTLSKDRLYLGKSAIYKDYNISVALNDFFSAHSAIIGNTGSGKSCCVARMLQNLFLANTEKPKNAHIILFDAYGEYVNAFKKFRENGINFIKYTVKVEDEDESILKYPAYFLDTDDLALLLQVSNKDQVPVLNKTLKLVKIFTSDNPKMKEYKNDIIASCLQDILTSGKNSSNIRDQIIAVLTRYNTENLNLDSIIHQPGYDRTFKQCLMIDEQGKMNAIHEISKFLEQFDSINLDNIDIVVNHCYSLEDIYYALEFALIGEGILNNEIAYKENNILKNRLQTIINGKEREIFTYDKYISKNDFIMDMFCKNGIININLNYLDDRFAKTITKLYSRLLFNYTTDMYPKGYVSFNIILEEAHRYVQRDSDIDILGYNIFDRITKEGRKYGTLLTFITQRPSELSETALSQCANFIVFKMFFPKDLEIVRSMSSNVSMNTVEQIKSLNPGIAFAFGSGFKIPTLIVYDLPDPLPESTNINVNELWY